MVFFIIMIVFSPFTAVIPAIYAGRLLFAKKLKIEKNYWSIGLFLLFCYSVFSAVINKSILSLLASIGLFLYFAISILFQNYFIKMVRINNALKLLVYLTMLTAITAIIEKLAFILMGFPNHRVFSTFGNPNMAGGWFASMLLVAIYLKSVKTNKKYFDIYNVAMILIAIALILTESSGAFIALIGSLFIYYLLRKDKNFKSTLLGTLCIAIVAVVFLWVQSKMSSVTPIGEIKVSFSSRYDVWLGSIKMFTEKPIVGWGFLGTLEHGIYYNYRNGNAIHSHNLWLTFLVSGGVVALGIYIYIKYNLFKDIIKLYKSRNIMVPLIVSLNTMVIIQGLVDCPLYAPQLGILFIATGAITYNLSCNKISKKHISKKNINVKCKIRKVSKNGEDRIAI